MHAPLREIEERVIRATGCGLSCPVDGRLGSAYVDTITGIDYVGLSAVVWTTHCLCFGVIHDMDCGDEGVEEEDEEKEEGGGG